MAQPISSSNLRKKWVSTRDSVVRIDTLSLIPNTIKIQGVPSSAYSIDFVTASIKWLQRQESDSAFIEYRVFPQRLDMVKRHMTFDTVMGKFVATPVVPEKEKFGAGLFDFGQLNYNGSFGRSLGFGNRQDVVVNSSLNLQLNGYIGDSILLAAAISDNNVPIQPDGNTQNLNEFDRVYIQFSKNKWRFAIGDIDIRQNQTYFLNFYKRLQGASFETENRIGAKTKNSALVSGAVAKGKFTRNIFQGLEGNQGPYRLRGANNELFFIVLAGTERVFIDGVLMQRGEDQDYVINYNTAEVTFTPRQMITKDKRIQIEFEYADRNYLNAQIYLTDEINFNEKFKLRVGFYNNNDAKNSPINQTLDTKQKQFLADIGDSVQNAYYPSAIPDTSSTGKVLYAKIDTAISSALRDSIFIFSYNNAETRYSVAFTDVGYGKGDYIQDLNNNANGNVYVWVAPDSVTGQRKGRYVPAILLVAPRKQQVFNLGADYQVNRHTAVKTELAVSVLDVNTFSSKAKENDQGFAGRILVSDIRPVTASRKLEYKTDLYYETIGLNFRPIERLRTVEFYRDWGLPYVPPVAAENLFSGALQIKNPRDHLVKYTFTGFLRSNNYAGYRNLIQHQADFNGLRIVDVFSYTHIEDNDQKGYFLRPNIDISKVLKKWKDYKIGTSYSLEHNELKYKNYDSLNLTSFSFDVWQLYFKSPELPNRWGISYYTRSDKYPQGGKLVRADRSQNVNLYTELMKGEHHQFRLNTTFRKLKVYDTKVSFIQPDETLLGRAEYFTTLWEGAISGNALYELGTGQEPRRDFSYLEVPAGQGEYTWIDYNNDGIQQLNEFEIARFPDQAKYIRIFTPTTDFIKANYLQFNYSLTFNPRSAIKPGNTNKFMKFIARFYLQSALQINRKKIADGIGSFNPFDNPFSDTTLLTLDQLYSNTISFNRFSSIWGIDFNNIRSSGRAFLSYGYETRRLNDWSAKTRVNMGKLFTVDLVLRNVVNELLTPQFNNRNYSIRGSSLEPKLSFTKGTVFRTYLSYKLDEKKNEGSAERAKSNSVNTEVKYNVLSNTSLTARFTYNQIDYNGAPNTTISYIMMDGLLPGKNFLWNLDFTQRLTNFLELSMQYEGRKAGESGVVHTGRAQLRALF
ncbi:hypothetical protein [Pollutibacter soli]|uniref:hypothetical protein n=1 Tax=Pollutibacter soli TaxID=3034157 RepID=UPI0030135BB3